MSPDKTVLTERIRTECARRGWDLQTLSERADVARTTLYHLLEGHTSRPRGPTINRLAEAFGISVDDLLATSTTLARGCDAIAASDEARRFDRLTNPEVDAVAAERPNLFLRWTEAEWDELYSTFGTGGPLNRQGVVAAAEAINRKRETMRRLHLVLETHLRVVAEELIDTLYRMVRPQSNLAGDSLRQLLADAAARQAASAPESTSVPPPSHDVP